MLNPLSYTNISDIQKSVNQFFILHENIEKLELDLSKIDTEMMLLGSLLEEFRAQECNPFELN
jgi:chaperonin cofactor prefoldin